jgi:hypothetical protein
MAFDIVIVEDDLSPDWGGKGCVRWGEVDPYEWESLFFNDFEIMTYWEFSEKKGNLQNYDDYFSGQIALLAEKYPMITRIKDFYQDAVFFKDEIEHLLQEVESLKSTVKYGESKLFLDQFSRASKLALEKNAGIRLLAD